MNRRFPISVVMFAAATASCGGDTVSAPRSEPRHSWSSGQPTPSDSASPSPAIECREDFDCCENPLVPCGQVCENGACVAALAPPPTEEPPPAEPTIDLSIEASWATSDLLDLSDGTPVLVRTVLDGFTPVDLAAVLRGFVVNPITSDARDPYLLLETDPADGRWMLTNGPAAGMSGSPIIVENRLAGALSFSVGDTVAPFLFIATPIEAMLAVEVAAQPAGDDALAAVCTIPDGAAEWFDATGWFDDDFVVLPDDALGVSGSGSIADPGPLVPGSAIAVLFITGDILNIGGIGTVTAVDGDAVWAFGHPMFGAGPLQMPFTAAEVMAVAGNPFFGAYKIAAPVGELLGMISEDRTAAIAGRFGDAPATITTHVTSTYDGDAIEAAHQTVLTADAFLTANFALFSAIWPITIQRDRSTAGSITYDLTVTVAETELVGRRQDVFSTSSWAEANLFFDLWFRLSELIGNPRIPLTLERVELEASVSDDRQELLIAGIESADRIATGDELVVAVELLPFGSSESLTQALVLEIPPDFPVGSAQLQVGSEAAVPPPQPEQPDGENDESPDTAEEIVAAFNAKPRSQVLVVQLTSLAPIMPADECTPPPPTDSAPPDEPPAEEAGGGGTTEVPVEPCTPSGGPTPYEPSPPPQVRVTMELDAMVTGYETATIEIEASESGGP
jgi:hypothetical protein